MGAVDVAGLVETLGVVTGAVASVGLAGLMLGALLHAFASLRETVGVGPVDLDKASWSDAQWDAYIASGESEATVSGEADVEVTDDGKGDIDPEFMDDYMDESRFRESLSESELAERERNFDEYGHRRSEWE